MFLNRLRNRISTKDNIERRLRDVAFRLAENEPVVELKDNPGWQAIVDECDKIVKQLESDIVDLSDNPKKNEARIVYLRAGRDATKSIISIVDFAVQKHLLLKREEDNLNNQADIDARMGVLAE
jgi:hypothetical protein